jgi:hypothetical protein
MDMIAITFDIAMFLSRGEDFVQESARRFSWIVRPTPELKRRHTMETTIRDSQMKAKLILLALSALNGFAYPKSFNASLIDYAISSPSIYLDLKLRPLR